MRGASPRMTTMLSSLLRRLGPRRLLTAQALERLSHRQHAKVVEAASDDLHADRKAVLIVAAIDRERRVFRHVPRHRVADVLERFVGIVERRSKFRRKIHYR